MHRLYVFSEESGEGEFVVISEEPEQEVINEWTTGMIRLDEALDIDGSATSFPCDRALRHNLY